MKQILEAYHYSKEHHTLILYLFHSEGYIKWQIPLVMHAGIVYRATKVEQRGWIDKRFDLSAKDKHGNRRVFRMYFRDIRAEYEGEIDRFFIAVKLLEKMPEEFLPDSIAFGIIEPPTLPNKRIW